MHKQSLHQIDTPVRWGDMDAMGHVNNTAYLRYAENARIGWLSSLGGAAKPGQPGLILKKLSATYHAPVSYPATLRIATHAGDIGRTSFSLISHMYPLSASGAVQGASVCDSECVLVWYDYAAQTPIVVPDWLRGELERSA